MSTSSERVLAELGTLGVRLWAESGQVRFQAPKGVLTPERLAVLRQHKVKLLELLSRDTTTVTADPEHRHDPFPLTDVQQAYLLGRRSAFDYGGVGCHGYLELAVPEVDPGRLERAWWSLVDRHDMLRAVVHPDGYQQVLPEVEHRPLIVSDGPDGDFAARVATAREAMAHRVYPTDRWPMHELRVTRSPGRAMLHLSVDLLVADYLSIQLLLGELDTLYRQGAAGSTGTEISFRDYVLARRRGQDSDPAVARDRAYWWQRLDDLPPAPELPTQEGAGGGSGRFTRKRARLHASRWQALRARANQHGVTPSSAVLTIFAEVIGRWSRHPRFTLNLTTLDRPPLHPDVAGLVGDFTSLTLLAVDRAGGRDLAARARAVHEQLWTDLDHRACGGMEVLRELARRKGQAAALMPVVYTSTIGMGGSAGFPAGGLLAGAEVAGGLSQTPQVWLDCQAMEWNGELHVQWDVREGVLPPGLVDDAFLAFETLLGKAADGPAAWLAECPVELPGEQARRRVRVNDTAAPLPQGLLQDAILAAAATHPDRTAVLAADGQASYAELVGRARAIAGSLPAGEIVGVLLDKGVDQIAAVLGVLLAGSAYLPVDTGQPAARQAAILGDAGVSHVVTDANRAPGLPDGVVAVLASSPGNDQVGAVPSADPDDLAYVIYTSGSSGTPKGVMISHRAALNTIEDVTARFAVTADDRVLGLASVAFDLSVYDIFGVLGAGGVLVLPDPGRRGDPSHWAELISKHGVTLWNSVPAQLLMLAHYLDSAPEVDLPSLRAALLSGDWIPVALPDQIRFRLPGLELTSLGGATEAAIWSIAHPIREVPPDARSIPYGVPLANQTFHVLDERGLPCPDWVPGELHIGGAGLALGYLGDPDRTAGRFVTVGGERRYRTGDLGRYLPDGTIEFLGREDDQIKIRGHRIELAEVEAALTAHPAVGAASVIVDGDTPLERRLVAFVSPARTGRPGLPDTATGPDLAAAGRSAAEADARGIDGAAVAALVRAADRVALLAMVRTLRAAGLDGAHTEAEIAVATRVADRHRRLLRRWLAALVAEGELDAWDGRYGGLRTVPDEELDVAWRELDELQARVDYGAELVRFLRVSVEALPELLRGEADPLALLFPQGQLGTAEAAYRDNLVSRHLNRIVIAIAGALAAGRSHPLRVLEVGAGTGGTSTDLIAALDGRPVDYLFTDISQFFLNEAAGRYADRPWVRFGLFDINAGVREQGLEPNSVDLLVCANVLHNARHAGEVLRRLNELLAPGGHLVFIEATRENYPLLVSMEFQAGLGGFTDLRAATDQVFLHVPQWHELLAEAGLAVVATLPEHGAPLSVGGQHVFVARAKGDRAQLRPEQVGAHVANLLPGYMVPAHVQVVDALPLTANGKLDRATLRSWLPRARAGTSSSGGAPRGELERSVASVWEQVLGRTGIRRDDDFFAVGGDSLLAAQLVGRLREQEPAAAAHDWDGLLRRLLRTPTVSALAAALTAPAEAPAGEAPEERGGSSLVALSGGSPLGGPVRTVTGTARVLVHDGSGTPAPYRALVEALPARPELLGLRVGAPDEYLALDPDTAITDLGARYARELLDSGAQRFELVGYCMGTLIATEVARALTESGAAVDSLTVISGYRFPYRVADGITVEYAFARVLGVDPVALGYPAENTEFGAAIEQALARTPGMLDLAALDGPIGEQLRILAGRDPEERRTAIAAPAGADPDIARRLAGSYPIFAQSLAAVTHYTPLPYAGDITFVRDSGRIDLFPALRSDMADYWRGVCVGDLRVVDVPGDHFSCLRRPHVAAVRDLLAGQS